VPTINAIAPDTLYRWCRDATGETHDRVSHQPKAARATVAV